ncbi:MAG TPA: helix-turn-helix transcriptional regulator [Thermoanaerobaculia bacterium]|jgi:AcrR family transcriptional regulator|nr:helix-turn-helix transcriptional regulator [Thermoanaerobaculia bacterium]
MKSKKPDDSPNGPASAEVRQLMDLLRTLARARGFSNAALARQADVALASLVRYFKGDAEPRLDFVLAVVRAIGLDVREFFEMAYPPRETPSAARQSLENILGPIRPGRALESPPPQDPEPKPEVVPLRREDIERMLDDLRHDVRQIIANQLGEAAAPEAAEPSPPRKKNGDG